MSEFKDSPEVTVQIVADEKFGNIPEGKKFQRREGGSRTGSPRTFHLEETEDVREFQKRERERVWGEKTDPLKDFRLSTDLVTRLRRKVGLWLLGPDRAVLRAPTINTQAYLEECKKLWQEKLAEQGPTLSLQGSRPVLLCIALEEDEDDA